MPSFFRSAEDVRIFFADEIDTPEKRKKHRKLQTIFEQAVRRPGTRGHFFFHRKCGSLGGKPILIFEPQGPVDRGIFQDGITRFGETLSGRFRCTAPGHIELLVKQNVSTANRRKYSRAIRETISAIAGIMQTGGDDRVLIITPEVQAEAARAAAEEKRQEAEEARQERQRLQEEREQKRQETLQRREARALAAKSSTKPSAKPVEKPAVKETKKPKADPKQQEAEREREEEAEARRLEAEERASGARQERLETEAGAQEAGSQLVEAEALAETARLAAEEAGDRVSQAEAGVQALSGLSGDPAALLAAAQAQAAKGDGAAARLAAALSAAAGGEAAQVVARWQAAEARRLAKLRQQADEAARRARAQEDAAGRAEAAALAARESLARRRVEEARAALEAAEAERDAASAHTGQLQAALIRAETARQSLEIAARTQDAEVALRALARGLERLDSRGLDPEDLDDPGYLARLLRRDSTTQGPLEALRQAWRGMQAAGAPLGALWTLWDAHPDLCWAQEAVESLL